MWEHPHVITSLSPIPSSVPPHSSPSSVCTPVHIPIQTKVINHHSKALSCFLLLCLTPWAKRPISGPQQAGLHPTSHAYQLCQPANGRAGWTAGDRNKKRPFWPMSFIYSEGSIWQQHIKKGHLKTEHTTPNCLATKPHGPDTPPLIQTSCSSTQHQSQPLQFRRGPPANQPRSQRYIIVRGQPEASSLHGNAALHRSHHHSTADED